MDYEKSMAGMDQLFEALLQQQIEPKKVMVDELDDKFQKTTNVEQMLSTLMGGQTNGRFDLLGEVTEPTSSPQDENSGFMGFR